MSGSLAVGATALGRGLVAQAAAEPRQALVSVPLANTLVICDEPVDAISVFSDRQHRAWQEAHGELPEQLLEFLQGGGQEEQGKGGGLCSSWGVHCEQPCLSLPSQGPAAPMQLLA